MIKFRQNYIAHSLLATGLAAAEIEYESLGGDIVQGQLCTKNMYGIKLPQFLINIHIGTHEAGTSLVLPLHELLQLLHLKEI